MTKILAAALALLAGSVCAGESSPNAIRSASDLSINPAFDITDTRVIPTRHDIIFRHTVSGAAGSAKPKSIGRLAGSAVYSYVWPTTVDSAAVGFEAAQGTLALVVTAHPDFDDTPLFDENGDGNKDNDGDEWHAHWVVLTGDDTCGAGALKVKDIAEGSRPRMPATAPGLPILLDSPGYAVTLLDRSVELRVPKGVLPGAGSVSFDGVTADLQVNEQGKNPLLCVVKVHDVASGNLSLPAKVVVE